MRRAAEEIIDNIKTKYIDEKGMVSKNYPPGGETIYADLDDILPFMLYFGETDFIRNQIKLSRLVTFGGMPIYNDKIISWRTDEYLGALCSYYKQNREARVKDLIDETFANIIVYLTKKGHIQMCYDTSRKHTPDLYSAWSGGLIEVFLENSNLFPSWKGWGLRTMDLWLDNYSFKRYGIFNFKTHTSSNTFNYINCNLNILPDTINQIANAQFYYLNKNGLKNKLLEKTAYTLLQLPTGALFQFMKANSNFVFALITAYRETGYNKYKDAINRWIDSVLTKMYSNGMIYGYWSPNGVAKKPTLTESFVMIDILCDTYNFVEQNSNYLNTASKIADTWLALAWDNGLIPDAPDRVKNHLDNQTDFSISLRRLSELTGNKKYSEAGRQIFESVLLHHKTENGYVTSIQMNGSHTPNSNVSPKYNGLLLKGIICWMNEYTQIYCDPHFYDLMKDR